MKNSVYHTVDDVPVVWSVDKIITVVLSKPELAWAALIDTAFDHGQGGTKLDFEPAVNCYGFAELQGLSAVAPCLIPLFPGSEIREQVTRLIRHCQGRPMLSFIGAAAGIEDLSEKWRAVHMVTVVDDQEMLLRFSDTRVLSYLSQVLTVPQWGMICGDVSHWMYFNRSGGLVTCNIPFFAARRERLLITKEQLEKLLDAFHPDALMTLISESMCDIVPIDCRVSERYEMIKGSCELAKKYEVKDNADILALAVAAYLTKGGSNADQRVASLLRQRAWSVGALGDAIVDAEVI